MADINGVVAKLDSIERRRQDFRMYTKNSLKEVMSNLESKSKIIGSHTININDLKDKVDKVNSNVEDDEKTISVLTDKLEKTEEKNEELMIKFEESKLKITTLESENEKLNEKMNNLEERIPLLDKSGELEQLFDTIRALRERIDKLESEPEALNLEEKVNALLDYYLHSSDKENTLKRYVYVLTNTENKMKLVGTGKHRLTKNILKYPEVADVLESNELEEDDVEIEIVREQECKTKKELNLLEDYYVHLNDSIDKGYNEEWKSKNFEEIQENQSVTIEEFLDQFR